MAKLIPKFKGKVKDGKIKFYTENSFNNYIQGLEDKEVSIVVKRFAKQRSGQQNKYYWGVVLKSISDFTGYDTEDLHTHFKYHFLRKKVGKLTAFRSTRDLDTLDFTEYIDKVIRFARERLSVEVPTPDSMDYDDFVI